MDNRINDLPAYRQKNQINKGTKENTTQAALISWELRGFCPSVVLKKTLKVKYSYGNT